MGAWIPRALSLPCLDFSSALNLVFSKVMCGRNILQTGKSQLLMNHAQSSPSIYVQKCPAEDQGPALGSCCVGHPRPQVPKTGREASAVGRELVGSHVLQPECQMRKPGVHPQLGCFIGVNTALAGTQGAGTWGAADMIGHRPVQIPKDAASSGRATSPGQEPGLQSPTG